MATCFHTWHLYLLVNSTSGNGLTFSLVFIFCDYYAHCNILVELSNLKHFLGPRGGMMIVLKAVLSLIFRLSILQVTECWVGPGNGADFTIRRINRVQSHSLVPKTYV